MLRPFPPYHRLSCVVVDFDALSVGYVACLGGAGRIEVSRC